MKTSRLPHLRAPLRALAAALAASLATPGFAEETVLNFDSDLYVASGDVELARPPAPARAVMSVLHPFGPSSPDIDYTGPKFSLGHEVRASAPSDLTVGADRALVDDNFQNGNVQSNDTISVTAFGDWPADNIYSVAVVVMFPTPAFDLGTLSYAALNWTDNKSYNESLRHRWVVRTGGKYYVNAGFLGRAGVRNQQGRLNLIGASRYSAGFDRWVPYDPTVSIFADFNSVQVQLGDQLSDVTAVGFYMDALDYRGAGPGKRQWQLCLVNFQAGGVTAPAAR